MIGIAYVTTVPTMPMILRLLCPCYYSYYQEPSIKYATLFKANFNPLLCHTLSHIPGSPKSTSHISDPSIFSRPSIKTQTKPPVQILSQLYAGVWSGRFCPGWLLSVPPSVRIHLLQQKVKHHFKFHVS